MDGGTVWNTNLVSAVERCREIVDDDSEIILDVIMCSRNELTKVNSTGLTISNFMRYLEISGFYGEANDVVEFFKANPNVNFRYLFMPTEPFNVNPLIFDNSTMYPML